MFVGAQHGGKSDVEIVIFDGHIGGRAAVLEKMDMLHFFHKAGYIVDVLDCALAHLVGIKIQDVHRGAPGSGVNSVLAQEDRFFRPGCTR